MKPCHSTRQGFSTFEYAALIAVVAAACIASGVYFSRAYQGQLRRSAESLSATPYLLGSGGGQTVLTVQLERTEDVGSETETGGSFTVTNSVTEQTTTVDQNERVNF